MLPPRRVPRLTPCAPPYQAAAENHGAAISSFTAGLAEAVAALHGGVTVSRQVGRIRLGNLPGLASPTVAIHQHLAAALLCARSGCWRRLGNAWRALCDAEAAVETFPEWGTSHARLGEALESVGDAAAALRSYRRAVAFSPGVADFSARLNALLLRVLGLSSSVGGAPGAPPPGLANPEARWVAAGGGPPRLWLELRAVSCCMSLDLGIHLWREGQQGGSGLLDPLTAGDQGAFVAEQQQLLEAALGVVAGNAELGTTVEHVLEAALQQDDMGDSARGHVTLVLGCLFAWCQDTQRAVTFLTRSLDAFQAARAALPGGGSSGDAKAMDAWAAVVLRNRALCRLRLGDSQGAAADAAAARLLAPHCPMSHARCGDVSASAGDWAAAAAHYTAALKLCDPGTPTAIDAASRLAVASNGGRGATGTLGGAGGTPQGSPVPSPCASPLLAGGASPSGGGSDALRRQRSNSNLIEALTLGGKDDDEAAVQQAVSTYMQTRKRRGKQPQGSDGDEGGSAATGGAAPHRGSAVYASVGSPDHGRGGGQQQLPSGAKSPAKRSRPGTPIEGGGPVGGNVDALLSHMPSEDAFANGRGGSGFHTGGSGVGGVGGHNDSQLDDLFGPGGDDAFGPGSGGVSRDEMTNFLLGEGFGAGGLDGDKWGSAATHR